MLKNITIIVLTVTIVLFWLNLDPEDMSSDDLNSVLIEYKCDELDDYESVPAEVLRECKDRRVVINSI